MVSAPPASAPDRLRVVHVSTERGFGGGEVQVLLLMDGLRAHGFDQLLVTPRRSAAGDRARAHGFAVAEIALAHPFDLPSVVRLARALRGADVVHLHTGRASWLGSLAAAWAGVPRVITRRTMRGVRRGPRVRFVYGGARCTIAVSAAIAQVLGAAGVAAARIRIVHDAIDEGRLAEHSGRSATRAGLGLTDADFCVLAAGKLAVGKGLDLLLRAGALLAEPRLVIVLAGQGPERASLQALATGLGLGDRVRFLGQREDVGDLLAACDALAMPSRHEGLGNAAMEAMGKGRPVVAARVGGLAELVADGVTGLAFAPGDVAGLASAIARLMRDPALAARLAAAGPARLDQGLRRAHLVAAHLEIYRAIRRSGG
jgi:glycosyltransferase involved in cell wall biosynthesis